MVARAAVRTLLLGSMLVMTTHAPSWGFGADFLVGSRAPEFALRDMQGNYVSVTALRGKVIVLNFWATWCPPCKVEIPGLEALNRKYGARGLAVVAVSTDSSEKGIRKFLRETPLSYRVVHDRDGKISRLYGVYSLPTTFIIDRSGVVIRHFMGEQNWNSPEMRALIEALLQRTSRNRVRPETTPVFFDWRGDSF